MKSILEATWWLVATGLGLLVVLLAFSFLIDFHSDNLTLSLPVAVQVDAPIQTVGGGTEAQFEKLRGNLRFPARQGPFLSWSLAVVVLILAYLLWIVTQLRHVFRSLSHGLPFAAENARRIRWVGLAVVFGELARAAIIYYWSYYTSMRFTVSGLQFTAAADLNLITMVSGLGILVIAEAFREGARLQEDQSLTI
jgi:hypothetical protein